MNNYTTHMLDSWNDSLARKTMDQAFPKSANRIRDALGMLAKAEKFIMPDYGRVFAKGNRPDDFLDLLHLPAPICALEYFCPRQLKKHDGIRESTYYPKRRIALCVDTEQCSLSGYTKGGILVFSCFEVDDDLWTFAPAVAVLGQTMQIEKGTDDFTFDVYPFMDEVYDRGYTIAEAGLDLSDEVVAAVEFMMTVNCENVKRERIEAPAKLNKKRAKSGKTPFYSYWLLDVFKEGRASAPGHGGSHNSPRFHFRRGHIRRYRDEAGNVRFTRFIKRMAVGNATLGHVDKTYNIKPMEKNS